MAKITAPFKISGTLDDLNFVTTADGNNYARMKGKTGVTSEEFKDNPIFDRIRNHGKEWGYCVKKAAAFRQMLKPFFDRAKDGSFAGRVNKLMYEIIQEDNVNEKGNRTLEEGFKSSFLPEILTGFEANKNRPLHTTLKTAFQYCPEKNTVNLINFNPEEHLNLPSEEATHVHLQMATAHWNPTGETFTTCYSEAVILQKDQTATITLQTGIPAGDGLRITFLYIGFTLQHRGKHKPLHRKHNTATLIACIGHPAANQGG